MVAQSRSLESIGKVFNGCNQQGEIIMSKDKKDKNRGNNKPAKTAKEKKQAKRDKKDKKDKEENPSVFSS
jgi:hypothetical protein